MILLNQICCLAIINHQKRGSTVIRTDHQRIEKTGQQNDKVVKKVRKKEEVKVLSNKEKIQVKGTKARKVNLNQDLVTI